MLRPLGMLQLRGSMLPVWLDLLPDVEDAAAARAVLTQIAAPVAPDGGVCHI